MALETGGAGPELVEDRVEAYEQAQASRGRADLEDFLPAPDHPLYPAVLQELVRVDLEYGWSRGRPTGLEEYRRRFPRLFLDPQALREIAFEEYRLRLQAGECPSVQDYQRAYGVNVAERPSPHPTVVRDALGPTADGPERPAHDFRLTRAAADEGPLSGLVASFGDSGVPLSAPPHGPGGPRAALPEVGSDFLGFRLVAELGRGAFARAFLARQGDLADRYVVLKVSTDLSGEPQALAQLQHAGIVPIYSAHRAGPLQALCMPYFGATTLVAVCKGLRGPGARPTSGRHFVDVLQRRRSELGPEWPAPFSRLNGARPAKALEALGRMTYVQAVVWVGAQLADGLAHAHERGVLHRDLKPANVLLTDEGLPMLLDFNLAEDTKLRPGPERARVGGTLPYMAPEQIEALHRGPRAQGRVAAGSPPPAPGPADARSDVYSLGALLFELLTGRLPFEPLSGPPDELLPRLLEQRRRPPPRLRPRNNSVSPAVEAIVRRCLEPAPDRRYPSAQALAEDLERQLDDLPLRHTPEPSLRERVGKWARRHPRLTSAGAVASVAAVVILVLALACHRRQQEAAAARTALRQLDEDRLEVEFRLGAREPDRKRALAGGFGLDVIDQGPDRGPIRAGPDFQRLVAARELRVPRR